MNVNSVNRIDLNEDKPMSKLFLSGLGGLLLFSVLLQWNRKWSKGEAEEEDKNTEPTDEHPLFI